MLGKQSYILEDLTVGSAKLLEKKVISRLIDNENIRQLWPRVHELAN